MDGRRTFVRRIGEEEKHMPYLHCPRCHRTAWVRASSDHTIDCRTCGARLDAMGGDHARLLATAVRERLAREAQRDAARSRFVRAPR
jgi:ribosomal protein S27E